jgi:hypothetical protein
VTVCADGVSWTLTIGTLWVSAQVIGLSANAPDGRGRLVSGPLSSFFVVVDVDRGDVDEGPSALKVRCAFT